jgi:glycerol-3-phosphate cytidylyltransferase-like family protein
MTLATPETGFTPYSTIRTISSTQGPIWYPEEERARVAAYLKYDEMYWNDDSQFALRVLEGENPIYIPNARTIVDTTSHYLLKGLQIKSEDPEKFSATTSALDVLLKREMFYSRFHTAKHAGVARGDFVFHMTADPTKPAGSRLSLNSVDPSDVIPVYDEDDITKLIRVHLIQCWVNPKDNQQYLKKLTYEYVKVGNQRRVQREEGIYELNDSWYGQKPELKTTTLPKALLPSSITTIPIYWFQNMAWEGQPYGSSELRGFEGLMRGISQASSDQSAALSLEGLGVYATDGGRPVDEQGNEVDWEVAPGKVMEVPTGSYFRRVEGLSSLKPSMDHINYIESKFREAGGLSDVALGRVDVQTAQSGIALAIKFMPTLAKIAERDQAGRDRLQQLFFDWKLWHSIYENQVLDGDILATIGDKLPDDRTTTLNELNNMLDRKVISIQYYRTKMIELGWVFPDDIQSQIDKEQQVAIDRQRQVALISANSQGSNGSDSGGNGKPPNQSNNQGRPNESAGTEAGQTLQRQARGGTSQ